MAFSGESERRLSREGTFTIEPEEEPRVTQPKKKTNTVTKKTNTPKNTNHWASSSSISRTSRTGRDSYFSRALAAEDHVHDRASADMLDNRFVIVYKFI